MRIDPALQTHVTRLFAPLNREASTNLPATGTLSNALAAFVSPRSRGTTTAYVGPSVAKLFSSAAVNIWMRGVHSFLVSAALTNISPVWASVAGYYSSHYSVRALAHLLGFFQLFTLRRTVQINWANGRYVGTFNPKTGNDREHRLYWKVVKKDLHFNNDPLFTENNGAVDQSDVGHRDRANYADYLPQFPVFRPLDAASMKARVAKISDIEITAPPIPTATRYPDVESVQVVAYHRLVRFRDLLDTILGSTNRFWDVNRSPAWAREYLDYQLTDNAARRSQFTK